jgi:hypothetical protein
MLKKKSMSFLISGHFAPTMPQLYIDLIMFQGALEAFLGKGWLVLKKDYFFDKILVY